MAVNEGIKESEGAGDERDVEMTWRGIKCTSGSGETGQSEESFGQIDGDEGGRVISPTLITTQDCSDRRTGPVCFCVCLLVSHLLVAWALATIVTVKKWP